ncbi:NADH dehydrogenase (ubiquinone) 1 beta subcomplex [Nesidiocoris tenuis]|uniref:NADH dehydrogenase [ubiquinone] 1 beta subcomplex subunit 9 n=1 Tax=Nesidiocoris tenuis TaxID=355587 RepID=A0ABN7AHM8_9HEMI|nr:NADH dehydrogenase (ubiquinone) 1 beta subcomplex [Nesidiocoris tenuis]
MASHLPFRILTHKQKVLSLYKRGCRNLESWYGYDRLEGRYAILKLRARFEKNRNESDEKKLAALLVEGEEELFKTQHFQPKKFANTIDGNTYGRAHQAPDWVLDYWHPLEKAQYPEYFLRREKRKQEFLKMWIKENGPIDSGHHH